MKAFLISLCFISAVLLANFIRNKRNPNSLIEAQFIVSFNSNSISVIDPDGLESSVSIEGLTKIDILTTEDGPWAPDVFWRFFTNEDKAVLIFPGGATGESELLTYLQDNVDGFNSDAVIAAMGSTSLASFELWKKLNSS